ncbi:nicotinate (nicotinamide) nucleotide adenylyltransferase [soil metagenome]
MHIGIFGGTFDPIHTGHLVLAERCREAAGLDAVWFLPSYKPPHKTDVTISRFEHRVEMVSLAIVGQPAFKVDGIERELPPPSYTANTLEELHSRHPGTTFSLVVGADCLPDLPHWHDPVRVLKQAGLVVVPRPGVELWDAPRLATALKLPRDAVRMQMVECPLMEIASREIRSRVAAGKTIRYLVPRAVEEYIREKSLYR